MRDRMASKSPVDDTDLGDENERRRSRSRQNGRGEATDDDLRKAIEESKRTAAAESGHLTAEERDIQEALRLSREEEEKRKRAAQDSTESALFDDNNQLCVTRHILVSPYLVSLTGRLPTTASRWLTRRLNLSLPGFNLNSPPFNLNLPPSTRGNNRLNKRPCRRNGLNNNLNGCVNSKSYRHNNRPSSSSPNSKRNGYANSSNNNLSSSSSSSSSNNRCSYNPRRTP